MDDLFEFFPELNPLLGVSKLIRCNAFVEILSDFGLFQLYIEDLVVGIGDHVHLFSVLPEGSQKFDDMRMDIDQVLDLFLEGRDVKPEFG